jgi:Sulfatase
MLPAIVVVGCVIAVSMTEVACAGSSAPKQSSLMGGSGTKSFLYNLADDPEETTNLYYDGSYSDTNAYFAERHEYWSQLVVDPQIPSAENMYSTFRDNGGITPWLDGAFSTDGDNEDNSDSKDSRRKLELPELKQKYSYSDAPHIVFVFVDDWGWNDVGYRSTYLSWTTPTIDRLASEGIKLENHFAHELCSPSRGALLTGRYALRLGLWSQQSDDPFAELPLTEMTLAQELKTAGYQTYMVGKWDLGYSTALHNPVYRGFDYFYGYYSSFLDYWTKTHNNFLDLQEGTCLVTDKDEIDETYHSVYLFQAKAEEVISTHASTYPDKPMFLYYPTQLIHGPWDAPDIYKVNRCGLPISVHDPMLQSKVLNYCALNIMLDEVIANLTCALEANGMSSNTILVIASDNGG